MKREFLEGLGLNREQIDAVMSEYGKGISAFKEKAASGEQAEIELGTIKAELENSKALFESQREAHLGFKSGVIKELVRSSNPTSALAARELERLLLCCEDGMLISTLERIKDENPDAFTKPKSTCPIFSSIELNDGTELGELHLRSIR